ncbi:hypothetical protein AGMMS50229_15060 [Campylobacterota bacterium]|nr:hypothetical protein AGMMS50229_15060 [Campylobacterota bacterium]
MVGPVSILNNAFNESFEVSKKDYIDIYEAKSVKEISRFMSRPFPFCRYCNISNRTHNNQWGVSKKEKSEWIDE